VADGKLVGVVSVKDLVDALRQNDLNAPIGDYMSSCLHTILADDLLIKALEVFSQAQVGRLPVVDDSGNLAGILTKGDIANGLLKALQSDRTEEELRRYRASHLFEDIVSDRTSLILRYRVQPRDFSNGGMASAHVRQALLRLGASLEVARRTAIAVYEAEMNLVIHTTNGGMLRVEVQPHAIFIEALDDGPGIEDIELAMQPGYTTTPAEIKALGFGAGFGLSNIKRCVDKMWLQSKPGEGTQLEIWIYLEPGAEQRTIETIFDRMIS
jgi:anti-sigma regulatory factor (Ser/Thr protein kinase)